MSAILKHASIAKVSATTEKGRERAHEILRAAREILAADGYAGLSMRAVAAQVGISLGNVQHYYKSKDALVEALLLHTMDEFQEKIDRITSEMAEDTQLNRFVSTIDMFLRELGDPVTHGVFFEIWALASRHPFASALMDKMMAREKKTIYKLIRGMNPRISDEEYQLRSVLIVAQVEGLMLFRLHKGARRAEVAAVHEAVRAAVLNLATGQ